MRLSYYFVGLLFEQKDIVNICSHGASSASFSRVRKHIIMKHYQPSHMDNRNRSPQDSSRLNEDIYAKSERKP